MAGGGVRCAVPRGHPSSSGARLLLRGAELVLRGADLVLGSALPVL